MKHILWISRHAPTFAQVAELSKILQDTLILTRYDKSVDSYEEALEIYDDGHFDDLVVTLPLDMIGRMCNCGVCPIRSVHALIGVDPDNNLRTYRFLRYERIRSVVIDKQILRRL